MKRIISILIFFCIGLNWSTGIVYIAGGIILLLSLVYVRTSFNVKSLVKEDYLALSFLCVWVYGVILGFLHGNNTSYIVANFAGLFFYTLYFSFRFTRLKVSIIIKIIQLAGLTVCIISVLRIVRFLYGLSYGPLDWLIGKGVGISSTGQLRIYFTTMCTSYGLMGISLYRMIFHRDINPSSDKPNIGITLFQLILTIGSLAFLSASKGFMLGVIVLMITIPFFCSQRSLMQYHINRNIFMVGLLFTVFCISLIASEYFNIILAMFDSEDIANVDRYEQLHYLLNDLTIFGKGLGAIVPGSVRSVVKPYGFELTYLNLFHKFGIFALIFLYGYFYVLRKSIKLMRNKVTMGYGVLSFSCMGYLMPSIGNPLLFDPSMVILNCMVFYLLSKF